MRKLLLSATSLAFIGVTACQPKATVEVEKPAVEKTVKAVKATTTTTVESSTAATSAPPTIQEAKEFLEEAEEDIVELSAFASKVYWVQANFITDDTNACLLYTSPSPRDRTRSRMPSSA